MWINAKVKKYQLRGKTAVGIFRLKNMKIHGLTINFNTLRFIYTKNNIFEDIQQDW